MNVLQSRKFIVDTQMFEKVSDWFNMQSHCYTQCQYKYMVDEINMLIRGKNTDSW